MTRALNYYIRCINDNNDVITTMERHYYSRVREVDLSTLFYWFKEYTDILKMHGK